MTKHNILHMNKLRKGTKNTPKWRSSKFGGSKTIMNARSTAYHYRMTWQSADCSLWLTCNKKGYFGNTALTIPQRKLEWTSLGWKSFADPWNSGNPGAGPLLGPDSQTPRHRNPVESPRRLTAGLTTESNPSITIKQKILGHQWDDPNTTAF